MAYPPTIVDFKAQFVRGFVYGTSPSQVMDSDITLALNNTSIVFNPGLWIDSAEASMAYLYASAHFLVLNIQTAGGLSIANTSQGVNSTGSGPIGSKSVGSVSLSFQLPKTLTDSPILSGFMRTDYGMSYLQMLTPRLVGNVGIAPGPLTNWWQSGE